jgi:hypothetical protein
VGPPIHYYGDMNMTEDQDKNNMSREDLEKMVDKIIEEVFADFNDDEEEKDTTEEE